MTVKGIQVEILALWRQQWTVFPFPAFALSWKKRTRETTDVALGLIFELQINIEIVLSVLCDNNSYFFFFKHEHSLNIAFFCTSLSISSSSLHPLPPLVLALLSLWPRFHFILELCIYFDSLLAFISSHERLLPGLKRTTRKDPSARLEFSWGRIQHVALFLAPHYRIEPTNQRQIAFS